MGNWSNCCASWRARGEWGGGIAGTACKPVPKANSKHEATFIAFHILPDMHFALAGCDVEPNFIHAARLHTWPLIIAIADTFAASPCLPAQLVLFSRP